MNARQSTMRTRRRPVTWGMRTVVLALVLNPLAHPTIARADYNPAFYSWCMSNLQEGNDYCCAHSGGVVKDGGCVDPATLKG